MTLLVFADHTIIIDFSCQVEHTVAQVRGCGQAVEVGCGEE